MAALCIFVALVVVGGLVRGSWVDAAVFAAVFAGVRLALELWGLRPRGRRSRSDLPRGQG